MQIDEALSTLDLPPCWEIVRRKYWFTISNEICKTEICVQEGAQIGSRVHLPMRSTDVLLFVTESLHEDHMCNEDARDVVAQIRSLIEAIDQVQ